MYYIYKITNLLNNKVYIGQTNNPKLRWSQHKYNARRNQNQVITRAISKYGIDNFIFDVIASCKTLVDANIAEEQIILQYDSTNIKNGYNVAPGGNTSIRSQDTINKISNSLKLYYSKNNSWNKGECLTDEWKKKISDSHKSLPGTNTGKTFSESQKLNMSKSQLGKSRCSTRKFAKDKEIKICNLYVDGKSIYGLAKLFNCNKGLISSILDRYNIVKRKFYIDNGKNLFNKEQEMEICNLFLLGDISIVELSRKFNCGKTTIRNILLRNNVKLKRIA